MWKTPNIQYTRFLAFPFPASECFGSALAAAMALFDLSSNRLEDSQ
jgi:hypothetical protein